MGYEIFEKWEKEQSIVRAEFVSGGISATFTGRVIYQSMTELRLARLDDEMSISLFFGEVNVFAQIRGEPAAVTRFQAEYAVAVRIVTDSGASCIVYELRKHPRIDSLEMNRAAELALAADSPES
ncbi:MAG TPA: hypothetical protein VGQ39_16490 [Pyrinomonadaceae bacterium]|nr:hypothetical protein [Pyrinomonadaceae bacterium]